MPGSVFFRPLVNTMEEDLAERDRSGSELANSLESAQADTLGRSKLQTRRLYHVELQIATEDSPLISVSMTGEYRVSDGRMPKEQERV